jgi:Short C-terminal domain
MDCFCGCGITLRRKQVDLNHQTAKVAQELLAWDKARVDGRLEGEGRVAATRLIERGADTYAALLEALHRGESSLPADAGETWLADSEAERRDREYMTSKAGFLGRDKLLLTAEDYERLDRIHPDRSFSGALSVSDRAGSDGPPPGAGPARPYEGADPVVDDLERLARLFASGALSAAEFEAAKARVLGGSSYERPIT